MSLIVQKYGGTSVGDLQRIAQTAERVAATRAEGHSVVVVLSAMGGETDRLLEFAKALSDAPPPREVDMLLSSGEQVSVALLCIHLAQLGCPARSMLGPQVPICTDEVHTKARILSIPRNSIDDHLAQGRVVVVAGFQGVSPIGDITTLGRGGSDTTAVALAASLNAHECQIYTDVDGVYTSDPRVVPDARRLDFVTYEEMLELASLGARVLQNRAVEFASKYDVKLRVLSSFESGAGTVIGSDLGLEDQKMEKPLISGVAFNRDEAKLTAQGVPDRPGIAFRILGPIAAANIEVDMIVQNTAQDGTTDFTFTVHRNDYDEALELLGKEAASLGAREVTGDNRIVKISLVGVGMRSHAGIASRMFEALAAENINIQMISTSEIKVSVVVDEKYLELGVRALHGAFGLENKDGNY